MMTAWIKRIGGIVRGGARGVLSLVLLALATPVLAQGAHAALEKPNVAIAVGGKSAMIYLPLTIAERLGYFRDEGLSVEISDFNGVCELPDANKAVALLHMSRVQTRW